MGHRSQTITAIIITDNNALSLQRTLDSVQWVDDFVIIDKGSIDTTVDIARKSTQSVFFHPAEDDTVLLQYALSQAKGQWVFYLHPYEWVEDRLKHEIEGKLLNVHATTNGFTLSPQLIFKKKAIRHGGWLSPHQLRLVRKDTARVVVRDGQAQLQTQHVDQLENLLASEPYTHLQQLFDAANVQSTQAAYHLLETHGTSSAETNVLSVAVRTKWAFMQSYFLQLGCLEGYTGMTLAMAQAFKTYMAYSKYRGLASASQ